MPIQIVMPKLGWTMEEGVLAEWIKKDGERVEPGDILFTVESDKALQEVEAFDSGILRIPPDAPPAGSTLKVGELLAYLVQPGEDLPTASIPTPSAETAEVTVHDELGASMLQPSVAGATRANGATVRISPRAKRAAAELGIDWTGLAGSGRTGRIIERDVRAAHARQETAAQAAPISGAADISPVARRAAQELGVDLDALAAQHAGKRITREDVERAAASPVTPTAASPNGETRTPIPTIRRRIAEAMTRSAQTTAAVTLVTEVDATELVRLRKQLRAGGKSPVPSYNDLLVRLCAVALEEHPALNARLEGDEIVQPASIHIGIAVDTPRGLLVPVIRDVQTKALRQISQESAELIDATRGGKISPDALRGSTFTISNLGMYEIDAFTPIINLPECAILGVGRIVPKQVVIDADAEKLAIRHMMFTSLTFDHRVVDGAPAARFLQRVKQFVEQPYLWLVG
mgnify:CR=1 FL=1